MKNQIVKRLYAQLALLENTYSELSPAEESELTDQAYLARGKMLKSINEIKEEIKWLLRFEL